jgi:hypothetical protein
MAWRAVIAPDFNTGALLACPARGG